MSKTLDNLMDAFAGESQANRKYLAYAQVADKEGKPQIAKLFRAAAAAETIHAHAHLRNAGKIGDTAANLKDALEGETYEYTKMYPGMIKDAKEEGNEKVAKSTPTCTRRPLRTPRRSRAIITSALSAAIPMKAP